MALINTNKVFNQLSITYIVKFLILYVEVLLIFKSVKQLKKIYVILKKLNDADLKIYKRQELYLFIFLSIIFIFIIFIYYNKFK